MIASIVTVISANWGATDTGYIHIDEPNDGSTTSIDDVFTVSADLAITAFSVHTLDHTAIFILNLVTPSKRRAPIKHCEHQ